VAARFPVSMVSLLRCPADDLELTLEGDAPAEGIVRGSLRCIACQRAFAIEDGIAHLLPDAPADEESAREMKVRDSRADAIQQRGGADWSSTFADALETAPTLAALEDAPNTLIAELGCGTGRYTRRLAEGGRRVVAVDFSLASLRLLAGRLDSRAQVGLVWADVTRLRLAPGQFDRVLSTLHSNLPSRDHRMAALRLAAEALRDEGRFVFSMHHRGLRDLLFGVPSAGHYAESGIYRYHLDAREAQREATPYFARIRCTPISVNLPGIGSLQVSRLAQRTPGLRQFGRLLLAVADSPRRQPVVGQVSVWSTRVARLLGGPRADA
jgi:SAM-dependent methyltransferase